VKSNLADRRPSSCDERRWLLGLGLVTACSWGRFLATGSPKVDENYPSELAGSLLLLLLLAGYGLLVLGWSGLVARPPQLPRRLAFIGLAVAALMLPMLSNDVFSLLSYGSLAARGQDVYTTTSGLPHSVWYAWMGERWNEKVCVYGPATLAGVVPTALAGGNPWVALVLLRLLWFVPLALVMELSFRRLGDRPSFPVMVWLNPLWLVEGPGQLHADLLGMVAITAGIILQRRGRVKAGWVCYALAVLGKYSFAFTGFWFWLVGAPHLRQRVLRIPAMAAVLAGVGFLFYAPFWRGFASLAEPIRALASMNPGGSITEVVGRVVDILGGAAIPRADLPVRQAVELDRTAHATTWFVVSLILRVLALGVGVRVLRVMLRRPGDEDTISLGTGVLVVAVITLASHRFQSWYLLAALPFFGLRCTEAWRRWWIAAVALSVTPQFAYLLPRTAFILPAWIALSTAGVILVFLMSFKARYLTFDFCELPGQRVVGPAPSPPPTALGDGSSAGAGDR
jgi:hypothetical protein